MASEAYETLLRQMLAGEKRAIIAIIALPLFWGNCVNLPNMNGAIMGMTKAERCRFGENNKYLVCGKFSYPFMVEDSFYEDPYMSKPRPGILKVEINASSHFRE